MKMLDTLHKLTDKQDAIHYQIRNKMKMLDTLHKLTGKVD